MRLQGEQKMFTDEDYRTYFDQLESISKKALVIYANLINELSDYSIRSKLYPIMVEDMEAFRFVKTYKEHFSSNT